MEASELVGSDVTGAPSVNATTLAACCAACLATPGCGGYTWLPAGKACSLKAPGFTVASNTSAVSAVVLTATFSGTA